MSEVNTGGCASGAPRSKNGDAVPVGVVKWLSLAAAPVFAIMALLIAQQHGGTADILCSAGHGPSPLSGMALMYTLMSFLHTAPWISLVARRRS